MIQTMIDVLPVHRAIHMKKAIEIAWPITIIGIDNTELHTHTLIILSQNPRSTRVCRVADQAEY
jgi:hypothetical protein